MYDLIANVRLKCWMDTQFGNCILVRLADMYFLMIMISCLSSIASLRGVSWQTCDTHLNLCLLSIDKSQTSNGQQHGESHAWGFS